MEAMTINGCGTEMAGDFASDGFGRSRVVVQREAVAAWNGTSVLLSHEGGALCSEAIVSLATRSALPTH
jgi:hypothetical protein